MHQHEIPFIGRNVYKFFCVPLYVVYSELHLQMMEVQNTKFAPPVTICFEVILVTDRQTHTRRSTDKNLIFGFRGHQNLSIHQNLQSENLSLKQYMVKRSNNSELLKYFSLTFVRPPNGNTSTYFFFFFTYHLK